MNYLEYRWLAYALAAAVCASLINIFGKLGLRDVNSDVATAVRSVVQAAFVAIFCLVIGAWRHVGQLQNARPR